MRAEPLACVQRALWGTRYADDAGIVPYLAKGLGQMTAIIVTVFEAAGLNVWYNKRRPCCHEHETLYPVLHRSPSKQWVRVTNIQCSFSNEDAGLMGVTKRRVRLMRVCYKRLSPELCHPTLEAQPKFLSS